MTPRPAADRRRRQEATSQALAEPGRYGVMSRADWLALGWTDRAVGHQVAATRWSRPHRGLVVVDPRPDDHARIRAAWVAGGRGAVVGGLAAAFLHGLVAQPPRIIEIQVPHGRVPATRDGVRYRHVRRQRRSRESAGVLVTTIEETVLDLIGDERHPSRAVAWIDRACGTGQTTPDRLLEALSARPRLRHRRLVMAVCARVADGQASYLERWVATRVIRAHGLPEGRRQVRRRMGGRTTFSDMEIEEYGLVLELDGRLGHDDRDGRFRDRRRDNAHAERGRATLRYGWSDAMHEPCGVAAQIAIVLRGRGWPGTATRCGPACTLP